MTILEVYDKYKHLDETLEHLPSDIFLAVILRELWLAVEEEANFQHWIPCDADNPPPAEIPDWMWMAVWSTDIRRIEPGPIFIYGEWQKQGRPGRDFTHYLLVLKPEGAK